MHTLEVRIGATSGVSPNQEVSTIAGTSGAADYSRYEGDLRWPNSGLKKALSEIDEIQKGMKPTIGGDSVEIIRTGRGGPMYGVR
jgi:hypothetical protein